MISASEPLEFVPRGRQAVDQHHAAKHENVPTDIALLQRMQNVNISDGYKSSEYYDVKEINRIDREDGAQNVTVCNQNNPLVATYVNTEDELYVRGRIAIWSKGISSDDGAPHISFTCETPIKFAFFCPEPFLQDAKELDKANQAKQKRTGICLLDNNYIKVYCDNGETFCSGIESPISKIWLIYNGILLEKEESNTMLESHAFTMPRFFSLMHPLEEMCPVIMKMNNIVQYITESKYQIIFTSEESDIVLIYNQATDRLFACRIRKATDCEKAAVRSLSDNNSSVPSSSGAAFYTPVTSPPSSNKNAITARSCGHNQWLNNATPSNNAPLDFHSNAIATANGCTSTTSGRLLHHTTSLSRLQSKLQSTVSQMDVRKLGQAEPSKPVIPEYCLEHFWTDSCDTTKDFNELPITGFLHTSLNGFMYLCYLFHLSEQLKLVAFDTKRQSLASVIHTIPAKAAASIKKLNMIAVLAPCGTLKLYSGLLLVGKVHVAGILTSFLTSSGLSTSFGSFPRRSSLLATAAAQGESKFTDELHMLSPVKPVNNVNLTSRLNSCRQIRDVAGNRVTLVFSSDKMFRLSFPLLSESRLVSKCLIALKSILPDNVAHELIVKWYGVRNAPGSCDINASREWSLFKNLLLLYMGVSLSSASPKNINNRSYCDEPKKRRKSNNTNGSENDWVFLLHSTNGNNAVTETLPLKVEEKVYIFNILHTFHLLYEDFKFDRRLRNERRMLAEFLLELAIDLQLEKYQNHYISEFPHLLQLNVHRIKYIKHLNVNLKFNKSPNIFRSIYELISKPNSTMIESYPYVKNVNDFSRDLILILSYRYSVQSRKKWIIEQLSKKLENQSIDANISLTELKGHVIICTLITQKLSRQRIRRFPVAIRYVLIQFLETFRRNLPNIYNSDVYNLLLRPELQEHAFFACNASHTHTNNHQMNKRETSLSLRRKGQSDSVSKGDKKHNDNGMDDIDTKLLRLRFPDDLRVKTVQSFLDSSQFATIDIVQAPNISDHDFIEEQEKQLYALSIRTMSLPVGRGMFTLCTSRPTATQKQPIPQLCLSGKELRGATIEIQQLEVPPNMNLWPMFHNGVAAGLRISPNTPDVNSTWITHNKPKLATLIPTEHAGFLMALGLNGHLRSLSFMSIYNYLMKCDEITSLGLLLGLSATMRGTMDTVITKLLSVHTEALLPPTALELDVTQNVQIACLLGIGLVYQGSAKRHIAEVLLQEIARPPGPEMENYVERESYALAAGLALGLVTLGHGDKTPTLRDLNVPNTLYYYIFGGTKRPLVGSQKEKYKLPSFQIKEGDTVNVDVTSPGATLALGLMYFQTGNEAIANWMQALDTTYLLDFIRPDLLLLRIVARSLILWDKIEATSEWVYSQVPITLWDSIDSKRQSDDLNFTEEYEAQRQTYWSIICGAAISIGLRFAGTANATAFKTLYKLLKHFLDICRHSMDDFTGKQTVENCTIMILLSLSLVQAGTGDLRLLRAIRMLRSRVGQCQVTYGSQMAIHMALGFLFLGAGRYTLCRSPEAIASLIIAIFPKFPVHSNDNRYHLQAFRHLYVLAIEPRLFLPRDIDSGNLSLCEIHYLEKGAIHPVRLMAPCMLPELQTLAKVHITDPNYWHICFDKNNWHILTKILKSIGCIDIKQRAGCLSYIEDPSRIRSILSHSLTADRYNSWKTSASDLLNFSYDQRTNNLVNKCLFPITNSGIGSLDIHSATNEESDIHQFILQTYDCLTHDKMHGLSIYMDFMLACNSFPNSTIMDLWQYRILEVAFRYHATITESEILLSLDVLQSLFHRFNQCCDLLVESNKPLVKLFVTCKGCKNHLYQHLSNKTQLDVFNAVCFLKMITMCDIKFNLITKNNKRALKQMKTLGYQFFMQILYPKLSSRKIMRLAELLKT